MTDRSKEYIKRQRKKGIIVVKVMIPASRKLELSRLAEQWRNQHKGEIKNDS